VTSESSGCRSRGLAALFTFLLALGAYAADDVIMLTIRMVVPFLT
jgi:hypothetical protein